MSNHDFSQLYAQYPSIIQVMPKRFTSHQFILELARQKQTLYIEALYSYRQTKRDGSPAPFLIVHGILAQKLLDFPELVRQTRKDAPSHNIFGQEDICSEWMKL